MTSTIITSSIRLEQRLPEPLVFEVGWGPLDTVGIRTELRLWIVSLLPSLPKRRETTYSAKSGAAREPKVTIVLP